ncbi:MAG TPA: hypothetical protein VD790_07035 [Thermoleophilaceae bacterium]|nr:hypothetical protein [Thermoleophilaceae bacterium]
MRRTQRSHLAAAALACALACASPASALGAGPAIEFSDGITANATPTGIAAGPDGNMWFTEYGGDRIGRITPTGAVTEFSDGITPGAEVQQITAGPDGNMWFTEYDADRIGRITPSGEVTEFYDGITPGAAPLGIAAGADGNLWFTEPDINGIGRITPSGVVAEFFVGITAGARPSGIAAGPDGNLWFTEYLGNRIGRITPAGVVKEFAALPNPTAAPDAAPYGIAAGPDGNLWFTDFGLDRIGRMTPAGVLTGFADGISPIAAPHGITTGPDGNLWFAEAGADRVGRITPFGEVTEFSAGIGAGSWPTGIGAGPDGNLWFAETDLDQIGRIDTDVPAPVSGNLLRNPGFELGAPGGARLRTVPVPGWVTIPNFTVGLYGGADLLPVSLSDAIGGGHGFAFGGPNADEVTHALQLVDVGHEAAAIDDGRAEATLSGMLGGQDGQQDQAAVTAHFLNAAGVPLADIQIGPVTVTDRNSQTTLLARSRADEVPAGTRAIRVVPTATNIGGGSNNGYFDNLSLTLEITPPVEEPDIVAPDFLAAGLTKTRFRAGRRTTFVYELSEPATVRFTIERKRSGGGYARRGALTQDAAAGVNKKRFSGRVNGRKLKRGRYRATLRATDAAGNESPGERLRFRILKPR